MPKISNQDIYNQDDTLSMNDYTIGSNSNTGNKKTQTYTFASIFSLFYNFLGYNAFLNTTDTTTYPIGTPGCFYVFDENDALTTDFSEARKITFSSYDTYNFDTANYFNIIVSSNKFLFKLINLEDKNNFVFLKPSNFVLSGPGTTFDVDVLAESGLSNGSFVNYKRYLLVLEFVANTFDPADYDLTDFTNTSGDPFITEQDLTNAIALLPTPISNHSELNLDDGTNPHGTTKSDVGLSNVDNTSDIDKPISAATQQALDLKVDKVTTAGVERVLAYGSDGIGFEKPTSDFLTSETDPIFQASEASLFVAGDKTNLDNQSGINTGDETTLSIQTKRPLKTINNESLEGSGNVQINYNDLDNLPTIVNDKNYVHNQIVASNFWEIQHNLDKYPSVSIIDSGNNLVVGEIKYIDSNNIIITFTSVFSGKAYFN